MKKEYVTRWLVCFVVLIALFWASSAKAAELRIRKELVAKQTDRALITVRGRFDHVKHSVNSLEKDCDLHAPVRTKEIMVAVVGEFMNACSTDLDPEEVRGRTSSADAEIEGVFRIWFEHPGKKDEVLSEEEGVSAYTDSNPPHAVEIHPITRVGNREFYDTVRAIEKDGKQYKAKGPGQLRTLLKRKVTVQEYDGQDGEPYISIDSGCCLPNYFRLKAIAKSAPKPTEDGNLVVVDILEGQKVVAKGIRVFSIEKTEADTAFKKLKKNSRFSFWGITRIDGATLLEAIDEHGGNSINIPVEFVLLAIDE